MKSKLLTLFLCLQTTAVLAQVDFEIDGINTILNFNQHSDYLVVLVHGSGKQDMEGSFSVYENSECEYKRYRGFHFKIFNDLVKGLFDEGFSTLRYDKINIRNLSKENYVIQVFVTDLKEVLLEIKRHEKLKSKKIILFGWSEGVTVALSQLKFDTILHGIIGYGGVFTDPILMKSEVYFRHIMNCEGNEEKAQSFKTQIIEQASKENADASETNNEKIILSETLYDENGKNAIGERNIVLHVTRSYFQDFRRKVIETKSLLAETKIPVLLIHGQTDVNVPFENHIELTKTIKNKYVELASLEDTDHYIRKNFDKSMKTRLFQL
ncbi:MAG: alpha/beta hydrolase, partial [Cyclobacteriaceae bacterium]